jgi:hypothetical protein
MRNPSSAAWNNSWRRETGQFELVYLKDLPALQELHLSGTQVTDGGLVHIGGIRTLRFLSLPRAISDGGLAHIRGLENMRTLCLENSRVTGEGCVNLAAWRSLEELSLIGAPVNNAGLGKISGIRSLRSLVLNYCEGITDEGLACLKALPALEYLQLMHTSITDAGVKHLKEVKSLKDLHVGGTHMTEDGARELRKHLPNLSVEGAL